MKLDRILVAVDGSPTSLRAVEWAAGLGVATGAEIVAVHVLGLLERDAAGNLVPTQPHRRETEERFETAWCEPLRSAGAAYRCVVRDGEPVSVVLALVEELAADLVVLGSRGHREHPDLLLGSTSLQVTQRSPVPVTVVPAAGRPGPGDLRP